MLSPDVRFGSSRFGAFGSVELRPLNPSRYVARSPGMLNVDPAIVANGCVLNVRLRTLIHRSVPDAAYEPGTQLGTAWMTDPAIGDGNTSANVRFDPLV